ncbi:MAG: adenylyltransferase/cytidyltransferase family protein [Candidatus Pacebacteria bacterium]|nr:adenylyltransferase/cytidyltransferase family protein [Candidatus Paceibacterota bacterium]PIR60910.1 MAG: hypothetical protein COU67_00430 [Candidatus Pacebacteria bacterium CG10_big_fil_rev_8_21_14_0_10_44_54]
MKVNRIVLVTGVFDCLHQEHILFLQKAKLLGTKLVIGVESDERVKKIKGHNRPIYSEKQRVEKLRSLRLAQQVFVLPQSFSHPDEHRMLLQKLKPDILAVSSHSPHLREKQRLMQEIGGRVVVVHKHNPKISTTLHLAQKQQEAYGTS